MARILIIDDCRMMRLYFRRCLEGSGHAVEEWTPGSAMEVPDRLAEARPDLVLCDYQMTGANGATVARMVRRVDPDLPMVVVTAFHEPQMEAHLRRLGVQKVLAKPIRPEDLVGAVEGALRQTAAAL